MAEQKSPEKKLEVVTFVCAEYPSLEVVMSPMGAINENTGRKMKSKRIRFSPRRAGGVYQTSNVEEIEFLKGRDLFQHGRIIIQKLSAEALAAAKAGLKVEGGTRGATSATHTQESDGRTREPGKPNLPK